jgi:hypothetical protein
VCQGLPSGSGLEVFHLERNLCLLADSNFESLSKLFENGAAGFEVTHGFSVTWSKKG